jgi:hypothetical protein
VRVRVRVRVSVAILRVAILTKAHVGELHAGLVLVEEVR